MFKYYYNNKKTLKKFVFEGKKIVLSSKTKSFTYLLNKYQDLSEKINETAKMVYFNDDSCGILFSILNNKYTFIQFKRKIN
jgi:hypothetical protein